MAGESEYYNPIIQAMARRAQLDQQRERDVASAKQHSEDSRLKEQHDKLEDSRKKKELELAIEKAQNEHEDRAARIVGAAEMAKGVAEAKRLNAIKTARDLITSGVGKEALQNPGTGVNTASSPGIPHPGISPNLPDPTKTPEGMITVSGENLPASAFPTPQEEALRVQNLAKAKNDPLVEGRMKVGEQGIQGRADLADINNKAKLDQIELQNKSREKMNQLTNNTRVATTKAAITAYATLGGDPGELSNTVNDTYITGNTPFNSIPAKTREAIRNSLPTGWTPIDPKDKPKLDQVGTVRDILDLGKRLADEYSYDRNPQEALKAIAGMGEARGLRNQLEGMSGQLAELYGREGGRKTDADIKRAVGLIYSPSLSAETNLKNVKAAEKIFKDILKPTMSKYNKDQLNGILTSRGIDPSIIIDESGAFGPTKGAGSGNSNKVSKVENWKRVNGKLVRE